MPKVVKYRRCEPENMEIALEALRNGYTVLNAATRAYPLSKWYLKRHLDGQNYFAMENIQVIAEGLLVNCFYTWSSSCLE